MLTEILRFADERWRGVRPGRAPLRGGILAGADKDPAAKVAYLLFDQEGALAAVIKVARDEHGDLALLGEHSALRELWDQGIPTVTALAPEPLALERVGSRLILMVSAVEGQPMTTHYYTPRHVSDPRLVAQDLELAGSWLRRFGEETRRDAVPLDDATFRRWVSDVFDRYRVEIGCDESVEHLFHDVAERAQSLYGMPIPMSAVHGDYWMGNLLVDDGRVSGVVDWERASCASPPFTDIYKFPTSYGFYMDRAYPGHDGRVPGHPGREVIEARWRRYGSWPNLVGFGYSYFGAGWFPQMVRRFVLGQLDHLGVPHAFNGIFFPAFLSDQAMALRDPAFRAGYRSLLVALAEERRSSWLWADEEAA